MVIFKIKMVKLNECPNININAVTKKAEPNII